MAGFGLFEVFIFVLGFLFYAVGCYFTWKAAERYRSNGIGFIQYLIPVLSQVRFMQAGNQSAWWVLTFFAPLLAFVMPNDDLIVISLIIAAILCLITIWKFACAIKVIAKRARLKSILAVCLYILSFVISFITEIGPWDLSVNVGPVVMLGLLIYLAYAKPQEQEEFVPQS